MSNKPYLTREKIDTLLKQGIKKRDFEDQIGFSAPIKGMCISQTKALMNLQMTRSAIYLNTMTKPMKTACLKM